MLNLHLLELLEVRCGGKKLQTYSDPNGGEFNGDFHPMVQSNKSH